MPHTPIPNQLADISNRLLYDHCRDVTVPAQGSGAKNHPSDVILLQVLDHQFDFSQSVGDTAVNIFSCIPCSSLCCFTSDPAPHSQSTLIPFAFHGSPWQAHLGSSGYVMNDGHCIQQWVVSQNMFLSTGSHRQLCLCMVSLPLEKHGSQPEGRHFQVALKRSADLYS